MQRTPPCYYHCYADGDDDAHCYWSLLNVDDDGDGDDVDDCCWGDDDDGDGGDDGGDDDETIHDVPVVHCVYHPHPHPHRRRQLLYPSE